MQKQRQNSHHRDTEDTEKHGERPSSLQLRKPRSVIPLKKGIHLKKSVRVHEKNDHETQYLRLFAKDSRSTEDTEKKAKDKKNLPKGTQRSLRPQPKGVQPQMTPMTQMNKSTPTTVANLLLAPCRSLGCCLLDEALAVAPFSAFDLNLRNHRFHIQVAVIHPTDHTRKTTNLRNRSSPRSPNTPDVFCYSP
jgi:hypothetical protein